MTDDIRTSILKDELTEDKDKDYEFSRDSYYQLINAGLEALPLLQKLVRETEHPKAFEVLGDYIKKLGSLTDSLTNHQRKKQIIDQEVPKAPEAKQLATEVQKLVPMTTADFLDEISKSPIDASFDEVPKPEEQSDGTP